MNETITAFLKECDAKLEPIGGSQFRVGFTVHRDVLVAFYGSITGEAAKLKDDPKTKAVIDDMLKMLGDKIGFGGRP